MLVHSFIKKSFTGGRRPENIPLMAFSVRKTIGFKERAHQLSVTLQNLVEQLVVFEVIGTWSILKLCRR